MIFNDPTTLAAVREAFDAYESALLRNDTEALDAFFCQRTDTVRYGVADLQYGIDAIRDFRASQTAFDRRLSQTVIVAYGTDFATASTLFHRDDFPGQIGRQQQTWVRMEGSWRIVAAHVSMMAAEE